jgi:hypothetical protein
MHPRHERLFAAAQASKRKSKKKNAEPESPRCLRRLNEGSEHLLKLAA